MKKGKDNEKPNVPMFPRLHVNDTDKGGPRPPPRNKMALYERLSIPSQRFNPGVMSLNPTNTTNTTVQASTNHVTGLEKNYPFPLYLPPATSSHLAEKSISSGTNMDHMKQIEDDDFRVPVFVQSQTGQIKDNRKKNVSREKIAPVCTDHSGYSVEINEDDRDPQQGASLFVNKGRNSASTHAKCQEELRSMNDFPQDVSEPGSDQSSKSTRSSSTRENFEGLRREENLSGSRDCRYAVSEISRSPDDDACLHMRSNAGSQSNGAGDDDCLADSTRVVQDGGAHTTRCCGDSAEDPSSPIEADGIEKDDVGKSFQLANLDKCDVSTFSLVDMVSGTSISPDDVVAIIGQKRFWKARRAIANQQRVFAVQVFELHRLIKVQQLIAGSPELLVEDTVFLGKSSPQMSPAKKIRLEYVAKPQAQDPKYNSENLNHKMECSAENAVGKPSLSSVKTSSHVSNYSPISGNALQANATADAKMSAWYSPQPGHQWLIPVMSPSEGLVYKPYPGPGFFGHSSGGCGPYGSASVAGNFMNAVYGWPAPYQGVGVVPGTQPVSHSCFPPYGTPTVNSAMSGAAVEHMHHDGSPCSFSLGNQLSARVSNSTTQQMPSNNQREGTAPQVKKLQAAKESEVHEVQGSTASSPGEIVQGVAPVQNAEDGDAFPLPEQQRRVIKVVPHNRRSATESAARIFQSIQEERKHFDSV